MAPKNKGKAKAADASGGDSKSKLKPATSINVRHILCEKHSKKEEALEKLRNGAKFDEVAREMSEDKARQGTRTVFYENDEKLMDRRWKSRVEDEGQLVGRFREGGV